MKLLATTFLLMAATALFAQISPPEAPRQDPCSSAALTNAAKPVHAARKSLLSLPIGENNETDVSPAAQQTIISMKDALSSFIRAFMRCAPLQPESSVIQTELFKLGDAFELKLPESRVIPNDQLPPDFGKYGFQLTYRVRLIEDPRLVAITAEFSIACGADTVLLIFAPKDNAWEEVLHWQRKPYDTVAGGTMAFGYDISPPDSAGQWYVVVHSIAPWCSSTWSRIEYQALRPTADALEPKVLLSGSDFMWWGSEDFGRLIVERDYFDLRFHSRSIDVGVHNREWIRRYSVKGDTVQRVQPVAVSPRDFVDEWIVSPWEQASHWSAESSLGALEQAHNAMSDSKTSDNTLLEFGSIYGCSEGSCCQVELVEASGPKFENETSVFFQVCGAESYKMIRVSQVPDPKCSGRDLLDEMSTK